MLLVLLALGAGCASSDNRQTSETPEAAAGNEIARSVNDARYRCMISWISVAEQGTRYFLIQRADNPEMRNVMTINESDPLMGRGYSQVPCRYYYFDLDVTPGQTYYYRCAVVNEDGSRSWVFGNPEPEVGTSKPMTAEDRRLIAENGLGFYIENSLD